MRRTNCDSTTSISEATGQSVCSSNNILVEEAGRPDLARHERCAQDTDKESEDDQAGRASDGAGKRSWDGASEEAADKDIAGSELVAERTGYETNDEGTSESHDVGIGVLVLRHVEIFLDGEGQ